jgi:iron complex transport system ATP-binding protein
MALHADQMVVMAGGRVCHQGGCNDPLTHRALEQVFDHRIAILPLGDQWVALPR